MKRSKQLRVPDILPLGELKKKFRLGPDSEEYLFVTLNERKS